MNQILEDLKIFSVVISKEEVYFINLFQKDSLSLTEIKLCIAIGLLAERLNYVLTAVKFYSKALGSCFSKFSVMRKIRLLYRQRDYKSLVLCISHLLCYIPASSLKTMSKIPSWIDEMVLDVLSENTIKDLLSWFTDTKDYVIRFFKLDLLSRYKYWIEQGHELSIITL